MNSNIFKEQSGAFQQIEEFWSEEAGCSILKVLLFTFQGIELVAGSTCCHPLNHQCAAMMKMFKYSCEGHSWGATLRIATWSTFNSD